MHWNTLFSNLLQRKMPQLPTKELNVWSKIVWKKQIVFTTWRNFMAKDEPYIRASNSRWAIISLILMNTVVQNESESNQNATKYFSSILKFTLRFRQTPWNFHEMDCTEPDLPMVDICTHKPNCRLKGNVFCNDIRSMRFFLHAFSAMRHDKHCLAFAFTYREMTDFQGIAWIKVSRKNSVNSKTCSTLICYFTGSQSQWYAHFRSFWLLCQRWCQKVPNIWSFNRRRQCLATYLFPKYWRGESSLDSRRSIGKICHAYFHTWTWA